MTAAGILSLALNQLWQLSLVIIVIGAVARTVVRRRPHWAYVLWVLALVKCLTPPVWSSPTGIFSWMAPPRLEQASAASADAPPKRSATQNITTTVSSPAPVVSAAQLSSARATPLPVANPTQQPGMAISLPGVILGVWGCGAIAMLGIVVLKSRAMLKQLNRGAQPPPAELLELLAELRVRIGTTRRAQILVTSEPRGPALVGLIRPQIVLPAALVEGKTRSELAPIVAHELVHLRRGDHFVAPLQLLVQAIWWFHPLVWWMNRELNRNREIICDEEVLASLDCEPASYAQALLDIVRLRRQLRGLLFSPGMHPAQVTALRLRHIMTSPLGFRRRTPAACWLATVLAGIVLLPGAGIALSHRSARAAPAAADKTDKTDKTEAPATVDWTVVDGTTGKPLAGAEVNVEHIVDTPAGRKVLSTTHHVTDAQGKYQVKIPAVEYDDPTLALLLDVRHAGYVPLGRMNYGFQYLLRYKARGTKASLFDQQPLYPGEEVTGVIEDPDGKPVAGLPVTVLTASVKDRSLVPQPINSDEGASFGTATFVAGGAGVTSSSETRTDEQGRFRFNALKGGTAQFCVAPHDFATMSRSIGAERGDIGRVRLEPGIRVAGKVVDAAGKPVADLWVKMHSNTPTGPFDTTADRTSRAAKTGRDGSFQFEPVLPGKYIAVASDKNETDRLASMAPGTLPAAFDPIAFELPADVKEKQIEIRAVPHWTIAVDFVDGAGKAYRGGDLFVQGLRGKKQYMRMAGGDTPGRVEARVPRDLDKCQISPTGSEDFVFRVRQGKEGALKNQSYLRLGKLDHDVSDITFTRYRAPTLWIKTLNAAGKPIANGELKFDADGKFAKNAEPKIAYATQEGMSKIDPPNVVPLGEGLWRTLNLLPDEEFTLTVDFPEGKAEPKTFKLSEGETKELELRLAK